MITKNDMEIPDKEDDDEHINEDIVDEEDDEPYETLTRLSIITLYLRKMHRILKKQAAAEKQSCLEGEEEPKIR